MPHFFVRAWAAAGANKTDEVPLLPGIKQKAAPRLTAAAEKLRGQTCLPDMASHAVGQPLSLHWTTHMCMLRCLSAQSSGANQTHALPLLDASSCAHLGLPLLCRQGAAGSRARLGAAEPPGGPAAAGVRHTHAQGLAQGRGASHQGQPSGDAVHPGGAPPPPEVPARPAAQAPQGYRAQVRPLLRLYFEPL